MEGLELSNIDLNKSREIKNMVVREKNKREQYKKEADEIIKKMNRHLSDKQEKMNVIDMDRIDVIHKIHEIQKVKILKNWINYLKG